MFGDLETELWPGERHDDPLFDDGFDDRLYLLTMDELNTGRSEDDREQVPDFDSIPVGPYLAAVLAHVDRSRLNGFDLVSVLRARERMVAHVQAGSVADVHEIAYAAPGDACSPPLRCEQPSEFAADELRPALHLTRRAAENRMGLAYDLKERLPRVWDMLSDGLIDLARARVFADGTCHVPDALARRVVDLLAEEAPRLTTGQLRARIRKLCVDADPEDARKRYDHALEERRLVIEPTDAGTANLYLIDIAVDDARAIGRRVNAHMISMRKDGDDRSHDNLRADIAVDLLLGADGKHGKGLVDIRVDLTTLAGLDESSAEIPGMGPVIADIARQVADRQHQTPWQCVVTDDNGRVVDIVTTRRRPNRAISRHVQAVQDTCAFPGCRAPASECDYDHLLPWSQRGQTSIRNGGPKCRHDHILKDHGWRHQHVDGRDHWTSPLGRTYITQGQSP
jgi:hypothetical protein